MSRESSVKSAVPNAISASGEMPLQHGPAWRTTFAAALRVIDHHRANLDARMTIQRLSREEPRPAGDTGAEPSRG